jgi:hypothetical protein
MPHREERLNSTRLNLVLLIASTSFVLLAAELLLRAFPGLMPIGAQLKMHWAGMGRSENVQTVSHPYIGFLYPPNSRAEVRVDDVDFSYQTDAQGFRNAGGWPSRAEVAAVGDSFVFGYGVSDDKCWIHLLSRNLPGQEIVNLGLVGGAPEQYARVYETFGRPLHPKVLLLGLFPGNDLEDQLAFDRWLEGGAGGNYGLWRLTSGDRDHLPAPLSSSYLLATLADVWQYRSVSSGSTISWADGHKLRLAEAFVARKAAEARPGQPGFERVLQVLERLQALTGAEGGTHLIVLLFPTKEEVYLPLVGKPAPAIVAPFIPELRRRKIAFLDLTQPFMDRARAGHSLYFEVDGHTNAEGQRVTAEVVLQHLSAHAVEYGLNTSAR